MTLLDLDRFEKAEEFIDTHARPLDQALFDLEFRDGGKDSVVKELETYQATHQGFGAALEPDIRMENASVIATNVGLQYITDIQLDDDHELIRGAITYLVEQAREEDGMIYFPKVGLEVMQYPRAPWWNTEIIESPDLSRWPNPNAEVTGYLNRWSQHIDDQDILKQCNAVVSRYLFDQGDVAEFDIYQYLCWKRALPHLPDDLSEIAENMILQQVDDEILDSENLEHAPAHWLVTERSSLLYQQYPEVIDQLLAAEIGQQRENGGWYPDWQWGDEKYWERIEKEWAGKLTVGLLVTLKNLDLIENA